MRYFETRTLTPFAIYCLCAGTACAIYFAVLDAAVLLREPAQAPRERRRELAPLEPPVPVPVVRPGRFIRASLPSPSTSCAGTIASARAGRVRELDQAPLGSRGSRPVAARSRGVSAANQPAAVSVSCVLVYATELRR